MRTRDGPGTDQRQTRDGQQMDLGDVEMCVLPSASHLLILRASSPFLLSASICEAVSLSS